jgi:hypothetical protein
VRLATDRRVTHFVELAREYQSLVTAPQTADVPGFLAQVHQVIAQLYAAALALPEVQPDRSELEWEAKGRQAWTNVFSGLQGTLGAREYYVEMFAPYELQGQEPVIGSLADDLADIYSDLSRGLGAWDAGNVHSAVWEWRFHFDYHWGEHATGALRALHALRANDGYAEPKLPDRAV